MLTRKQAVCLVCSDRVVAQYRKVPVDTSIKWCERCPKCGHWICDECRKGRHPPYHFPGDLN